MLSERDRRDLADIERRLCGDDPELDRAFQRVGVRRWPYTVAIVVLAVLSVGLIVVNVIGPGLLLGLFAVGAYFLRRWRTRPIELDHRDRQDHDTTFGDMP